MTKLSKKLSSKSVEKLIKILPTVGGVKTKKAQECKDLGITTIGGFVEHYPAVLRAPASSPARHKIVKQRLVEKSEKKHKKHDKKKHTKKNKKK